MSRRTTLSTFFPRRDNSGALLLFPRNYVAEAADPASPGYSPEVAALWWSVVVNNGQDWVAVPGFHGDPAIGYVLCDSPRRPEEEYIPIELIAEIRWGISPA